MKRKAEREKIIKSRERVKRHGEVFTPDWVARQMCDMLQKEEPSAFGKLESTFLEPCCGTGNFLVEILRRKLLLCRTREDGLTALRSIYAVELLEDNVIEARARMLAMFAERFGESDEAAAIVGRNIVRGDFLKKRTPDGAAIWFLEEQEAEQDDLRLYPGQHEGAERGSPAHRAARTRHPGAEHLHGQTVREGL